MFYFLILFPDIQVLYDGSPCRSGLYISRSTYLNGTYPGMLSLKNQTCYAMVAGREIEFPVSDKNCEVLILPTKDILKWEIHYLNNTMPEKAYVSGRDLDGTPLYIIAIWRNNTQDHHCTHMKNGQISFSVLGQKMNVSAAYIVVEGKCTILVVVAN